MKTSPRRLAMLILDNLHGMGDQREDPVQERVMFVADPRGREAAWLSRRSCDHCRSHDCQGNINADQRQLTFILQTAHALDDSLYA